MLYHVATYVIHDAYGGPEEGGWTFMSGRLIASASVNDLGDAEDIRDMFRRIYPNELGNERMTVMWSDRFLYPDETPSTTAEDADAHRLQRFGNMHDGYPLPTFPATRPHYE